jgi:hypothetical protein
MALGTSRLLWLAAVLSLFIAVSYLSRQSRIAQLKAITCNTLTLRYWSESSSGTDVTPSLSRICNTCSFAGTVYSCGTIFNPSFYRSENPNLVDIISDEAAWQHWANEGFLSGFRSHGGERIVKIVLMTKDEYPLIRDWLLYHGHIFGPENIYIIDGSSVNSQARKFIDGPARLFGVTVFWLPHATLEETGEAFNAVLRSLRWSADIVLKLDTDEFLGLGTPLSADVTSISLIKKDILSYINTLPLGGKSNIFQWQVAWNIMSQPRKSCVGSAARPPKTEPPPLFSTPYRFWKIMMAAHAFADIDLGAHGGKLREPFASLATTSPRFDSNLAVVHVHFPCFDEFYANTLRACQSHGYVHIGDSKSEMMEKLTKLNARERSINSWHKVEDLLSILKNESASRHEYLLRLPPGADALNVKFVQFPFLRDLLDQLGQEKDWGK